MEFRCLLIHYLKRIKITQNEIKNLKEIQKMQKKILFFYTPEILYFILFGFYSYSSNVCYLVSGLFIIRSGKNHESCGNVGLNESPVEFSKTHATFLKIHLISKGCYNSF